MNTDSDQCPICDGTLRFCVYPCDGLSSCDVSVALCLCGSPGSNLAVGNSVSAYDLCETVRRRTKEASRYDLFPPVTDLFGLCSDPQLWSRLGRRGHATHDASRPGAGPEHELGEDLAGWLAHRRHSLGPEGALR